MYKERVLFEGLAERSIKGNKVQLKCGLKIRAPQLKYLKMQTLKPSFRLPNNSFKRISATMLGKHPPLPPKLHALFDNSCRAITKDELHLAGFTQDDIQLFLDLKTIRTPPPGIDNMGRNWDYWHPIYNDPPSLAAPITPGIIRDNYTS